jgi:putative flippase GtrA
MGLLAGRRLSQVAGFRLCRPAAAVLSGAAMQFPAPIDNLLQRLLPAWVDRTILAKAVSFALIGCVNVAVDFVVFSIGYFYFGPPIMTSIGCTVGTSSGCTLALTVAANIIAWCVAVTNSYVLNSMITFAVESGRRLSVKAYLTFATTQAGGLIANTTTVVVASFFIPVLFAKVLASGASFVVDFTLSHLVVFRRRQDVPLQNQQGDMRGSQREP